MSGSKTMDNTDSTDRQKHANPGGHTGGDITQPFADAPILMAAPMNLQNQNQNIDGQPEQPQQTGAIIGQAREILNHSDASEVQIPQQMGRLLIQGSHLMNEHLQYTSSNVISHSNGSASAILGPHEPVLTQHQYQERL